MNIRNYWVQINRRVLMKVCFQIGNVRVRLKDLLLVVRKRRIQNLRMIAMLWNKRYQLRMRSSKKCTVNRSNRLRKTLERFSLVNYNLELLKNKSLNRRWYRILNIKERIQTWRKTIINPYKWLIMEVHHRNAKAQTFTLILSSRTHLWVKIQLSKLQVLVSI